MNEGEYYAMVMLLNELKKYPEVNQDHIRYIESQLNSITPTNFRGDSIG